MDTATVVVAAIGAVPATLAAIAGIIAARRTIAGNEILDKLRKEVREEIGALENKFTAHANSRRLHRG